MAPSTALKSSKTRVIYWFRTDLRLHDSPALKAALDLQPDVFYPIWTWDPHYVYRARVGPNRWQFLTDCQRDLSSSLTKLNPKQKLHLIREAPQTVFPKLFKLWKITHLVFEKDTDAYARDRDKEVIKLAKDAGVEVVVKMGRTLYDPDELVKHNGGRPTMSMSQTQKAAAALGDPAKPIAAPTSLPDPGDTDLSSIDHERPNPAPDLNSSHRDLSQKDSQYTSIMGPNKDFSIPTLSEMGISPATTPHRGGETIALATLSSIISNSDYTGLFEKPKTAPTAFSPQSTTLLSPHHHFGSLSIRLFYWRVEEVYQARKRAKKPNSSIPENLHGQLLFRDMYFGAQAALGHSFAQEAGNKVCKFIDWHLKSDLSPTLNSPTTTTAAKPTTGSHAPHPLLSGSYTIDSPTAEAYLQRWKSGITGFPWIDALMRQLRCEGWIHHLGRHAVACFLTRGGCYVHWERGAEVFEEWLLDHEVACNAGNWMWLSCAAFYSQFFRVYSPVAFPKKTDPNGEFVRRWVPELERFDKKFIYEPWRAPVVDQRRWGCLVRGDGGGGDVEDSGGLSVYPKPMFEFEERRKFCIEKIKQAYKVGMRGDDPRVLDGGWRKVFGCEDEGGEGKGGLLRMEKGTDETGGSVAEKVKEKSGDVKLVLGEKRASKRNARDAGENEGEELPLGNAEAAAKPATRARGGAGKQQQPQQTTLDMMIGPSKKKPKR